MEIGEQIHFHAETNEPFIGISLKMLKVLKAVFKCYVGIIIP
jgi:hypothetical protein